MNCREFAAKVHEYLDERLSPHEDVVAKEHLRCCQECSRLVEEFRVIRQILAVPSGLSEGGAARLLEAIQARSPRPLSSRLWQYGDDFRCFLRDLDSRVLWSRLVAVPVSIVLMLVVVAQLPRQLTYEWTYATFAAVHRADLQRSPGPVMVNVWQGREQMDGLVDTIWRTPYEDSLSFVAEIDQDGTFRIGDILEYPKSEELLDAVDSSLRGSRWNSGTSGSLLIYSLQKVDVYADEEL